MWHPAKQFPSRGFSLTELLIVIAILALLGGVAVPLGRSVLSKSREAACLNNLRNLGVALEGYLQDHQQTLPELEAGRTSKHEDLPVLETVLLPYVRDPDAFRCPQDSEQFAKSGSSYLWNSTLNGSHRTRLNFFGIAREEKIPLIADKEAWHPNGTNFLYADYTSSNQTRFTTGTRQ